MSNARQNEPDAIWTMIFIVVVVILGLAIFWHIFRVPILEGLRWLRLAELWIINLLTGGSQSACIAWLRHAQINVVDASPLNVGLTYNCFGESYIASLPSVDTRPSNMSSFTRMVSGAPITRAEFFSLNGTSMGMIEQQATNYIRWPIAAAFAFIAYYITFLSPRNKFRTRFTLESFIAMQAKMWPVITPIVDFNPIKSSARQPGDMVPDKLPLFAEALGPEEWLSYHRIAVTNGAIDREAARRALVLQLGPRWNGIDNQAPYLQALYAAFVLKAAQKREESDEFLGRIAMCWTAKAGFVISATVAAETKKVLSDMNMRAKTDEAAAQHAFRTTAILAALRYARSMGGVLAPAQFLWLRGQDRNLWYALNNLGRRSYHSEGMGSLAHFMAEQAAKKPLPIPRVDTAIVTVNGYLNDPEKRSIPIPPREGESAKASPA